MTWRWGSDRAATLALAFGVGAMLLPLWAVSVWTTRRDNAAWSAFAWPRANEPTC